MAKKKTKAQKQKARELRRRKRKALQQQSFKAKKSKGQNLTNAFFKKTSFGSQDKSWDEKTKIKTGLLRTKEISFFNFIKWSRASSLDKSFAVAECFVNMVSELKYDDLDRFSKITIKGKQGLDKQCQNKQYTVEGLQAVISSLIANSGEYGTDKNQFVEYFMQLRDRIKCKKMKFCLLARVYQADSRWVEFEELRELRKNFSFEEMVWITCRNNDKHRTVEFVRNVQRWIDDINKLEQQDNLRVYRSFRVKRGEKIRQGLTRDCKTMESGKGNSFTFRKAIALKVNQYINTYMISKYLELTGKKNSDVMAKSVLQGNYMNKFLTEFTDDDRFNDTFGVLGEFKIKKEDIVIYSDGFSEAEVVMDYRKAKLEDYTFVNIIHFFTVQLMGAVCNHSRLREFQGETHLESKTANAEQLFDTLYWFVSKYFKKNKVDLKNCVRNGKLNHRVFSSIMKQIQDECFDGDECSLVYLSHKDDCVMQFAVITSNEQEGNREILGVEHKEDDELNVAEITGVRQTKKKAFLYSEYLNFM